MNYSIEAPLAVNGVIHLPASKSISNRALIINALSGNRCQLQNVAACDDTDAMVAALASGTDGDYINIGAAGTAMRFLTAYLAVQPGRTVTLDGSQRMRRRPIGPLVDALNACGADVRYAGTPGFPPLEIHGRNFQCQSMVIDASMSSQFISAMLMIAPMMGCSTVELEGKVVSRPYIDMTLGVMAAFGMKSTFDGSTVKLQYSGYKPPKQYVIENDWTAASYWYAIVANSRKQSRILLPGLFSDSMQGDASVLTLFKNHFGVNSHFEGTDLLLHNDGEKTYTPILYDFTNTPDLAQTAVVTACTCACHFTYTGLATLRIKETDRIEALRSQMLKLGFRLNIDGDIIKCMAEDVVKAEERPVIETFDDHRMAMAFATAAIHYPGMVIANAEVVTKSYPQFWQHLQQCGFSLKEVEL